MRNEILVRLHAAGASHSELRLFSNALERSPGSVPGIRTNGTGTLRSVPASAFRTLLSDSGIREDRFDVLAAGFFQDSSMGSFDRSRTAWARVITERDDEYPSAFLNMPRRPYLLYVRWNIPKPDFSVSVVGSRKASPYGKEVTKRFVSAFVRHGAAIVSGGAAWIDSEAHSAAMAAGWTTLAFVGTGIDVDYPRSNRQLFDSIVNAGGAVVSAFAPGVWPMAYHFPIRNALVACFSDGTLVTEASEKSGSLITAKLALDFWKEVFAVPGDVIRPGSLWANSLIRDGSAKCVSSPDDVLCEFSQSVPNRKNGDHPSVSTDRSANADVRDGKPRFSPVFSALSKLWSSDPESLSLETGVPIGTVLSELSELEISWMAYGDLFGNYSLKR